MEEVRQLVQEEGREARNLVAFHVAVDTPARVARKPPRSTVPPRRAAPRPSARLRSASAGRDKRSELRARYWALLFGDLQRAIGEIYNTVEAHENLNECQEVILVLENYTRDFKALGEWFRLKWEYDNTPPPQRPQSLAWEIRKTDFVRPESRRTHSVKSSPSVSGKNSPCLSGHNTPSGKNSPNLTGKASPGSGKISPRITGHSSSPKANIEFFSSKISSKITTKPEPKMVKEASRLSDIKEKEVKELVDENTVEKKVEVVTTDKKNNEEKEPTLTNVEIGKAKEHPNVCPKPVILKSPKRINQDLKHNEELSSQAKATIAKLDAMENEFLIKQLNENAVKNDNMNNHDKEIDIEHKENLDARDTCKDENKDVDNFNEDPIKIPQDIDKTPNSDEKGTNSENSPVKSEDNFADVSNESSPKSNNETIIIQSITNGEKITNHIETIDADIVSNIKTVKDIIKICDENSNEKEIVPMLIENNISNERDEKEDINQITDSKSSEPGKDAENKDDTKKDLEVKKLETKRPAYSQAAAKPKPPNTTKVELKTPTRLNNLTRSKTAVDIRPSTIPKTQRMPKRNQTNKCSYPFNLTTGRTSLFDTPTPKPPPKKPINKPQMASGDAKPPQSKSDLKKRPPRPASLKINDKADKREKVNPSLEKIKDCDEYSSSDTIVTQIDISRIESSESLKTLVPEEGQDVANSIEVLNVNKNDNEGWLTVKSKKLTRESKKQGRSHWANRFHQPSATTSLPTLNMIESPKQESKPIMSSNADRAKSEQPQNKPEKVVQVVATEKEKEKEMKQKDPAMIRQKSDVTGLKTRSKNDLLKSEKLSENDENGELTKNRLHSSLESLTTGLARSQESTEDRFDFDKWKEEFKFTFKYLDEDDPMSDDNELLRACDPSEMSEIAEMTSQIEENERKISLALDFQSEEDQRKLCEEEDLLNRQIMELQQVSDIDLDTETDDTETDAEILCEDNSATSRQSTENLTSLAASLEDQYETALAGMSWAERVDTLVVLEALVARDPGRAQQLHAKLSQGIKRRGSFQDALRRLQAKQARAERQRLEYQTERARKIHQLLARVEEVKVAKNQLIEEKRLRMERRLQKAAENRDQHLKDIVRKAHDEEEKLREIAFIKQLEAENRRHEFLDQCRSQNTRLRQMRRERLDKLELKAAREAAVGARRQALEAARRLRVAGLLQRRRERDARTRQLRERTQRERHHAAREKAEGVKSRLSALAAAAELEADALRSRIRDKQDASQQRLESHLQAIREKATGPRQPTTSESHDQASKEQKELEEAAQRIEQERKEREKQKAIKKRARKVRQKLLAASIDFIPADNSSHEVHAPNKLIKVLNQISSVISPLLDTESVDKRNGINGFEEELKRDEGRKKEKKKNKKLCKAESVCSSLSDMSKGSGKERKPKVVVDMAMLERNLNELHRMMDRFDKNFQDKAAFQKAQGLQVLGQLLAVASDRDELAVQFSAKCVCTAVQVVCRVVPASAACAARVLACSAPVHLARLLADQLEKDLQSDPKEMELAKQLSDCLSVALDSVLCSSRLYEEKRVTAELELLATLRNRAHMLISYLCLCGCISRAEKAGEARESVQTLLTVCADLCHPCDIDVGSERASAVQSLRCALGTSVCGSRAEFCMLFASGAGLSHGGGFVRAARTAHLLRALAELDHQIVQDAFGEGGWPLEFRAAVARLLSQHAPNDKEAPRTTALRLSNQRLDQTLSEAMVLDLIVLVGFVVVNNPQLQETICDGWSVIKTLCTLPANWLVSRAHCHALLPTLVALSDRPGAAAAIASELSVEMLDEYMNSPEAQKVKLVQVIKQGRSKKGGKK